MINILFRCKIVFYIKRQGYFIVNAWLLNEKLVLPITIYNCLNFLKLVLDRVRLSKK